MARPDFAAPPGLRGLRWRQAIAVLLLAGALWQLGGAAYIHAKAILAQVLLQQAWSATLLRGTAVRPWPWADTFPVARLMAPAHGQNLIVLAGASGATLAFGPGRAHAGTPAAGITVLAGHRDTHFSFLRHLRRGDRLQLQLADGETRHYHVDSTRIADSRAQRLALTPARERLVLITCYPFDAVAAGGPLRYVVSATRHEAGRYRAHNSPQLSPRGDILHASGSGSAAL